MFDTEEENLKLEKIGVIYFKESNVKLLDFEDQSENFKRLYNSYPIWDDIEEYAKIIKDLHEITK